MSMLTIRSRWPQRPYGHLDLSVLYIYIITYALDGNAWYSYTTSFGQVPVLVIFILKCSLPKNFNLLLHL